MTPVPPTITLSTQPYKSFADTLVTTLTIYEQNRLQSWVGKGHPNDLTRLFGVFLRNHCQGWLTDASTNQKTLDQVRALRQYFEALAGENVFADGEGHGSFLVLLHNLATPLSLLEKRLQYEIRLKSAREHFAAIKAGVSQVLSEWASYLFYALAAKDRSALPFSLINVQAQVVHRPLSQALATREGLLLKQWIYAPETLRVFLLQHDPKELKAVLSHQPISLMGTSTPTPLLDEKGGVNATWREYLTQSEALATQLPLALEALPLGICPLLCEAKALSGTEGDQNAVTAAIKLHGLLQSLATYQYYLHACWQLAGFGGDHCVYDQLQEAIKTVLTELLVFNQALERHVSVFQGHLDSAYKQALTATSHSGWQKNYHQAKAHQEKLLGVLKGCKQTVTEMIAQAQNPEIQVESHRLTAEAC